MTRLLTFGLAFCLALFLAACGFTLRGVYSNYSMPFKTLSVNLPVNTYLSTLFRRHIESGGAKVIDNPKEADVVVDILEERRERKPLSISTAGRIREYALFYTLTFQVKNKKDRVLADPAVIQMRRTLTYSESQSYAKDKEEELLYLSMQDDALTQVLHRLAELKFTPDSDPEPEPEL